MKKVTSGVSIELQRNPDYFIKDRPYLDGYKFFISTETSVRAAALRSGRAFIEFRDMPGPDVEAIKKQLGNRVAVQETPVSAHWGIWPNNNLKPFSDVRVRQAINHSLDRRTIVRNLIAGRGELGGTFDLDAFLRNVHVPFDRRRQLTDAHAR